MDDIDPRVPQLSVGNTSFHLDVHPSPLYPFGYGLTYSQAEFQDFHIDDSRWGSEQLLSFSVRVANTGDRPILQPLEKVRRCPASRAKDAQFGHTMLRRIGNQVAPHPDDQVMTLPGFDRPKHHEIGRRACVLGCGWQVPGAQVSHGLGCPGRWRHVFQNTPLRRF